MSERQTRSVRQYRREMARLGRSVGRPISSNLSIAGRWRHYFTPERPQRRIGKAALLRDQWGEIAGILVDEEVPAE